MGPKGHKQPSSRLESTSTLASSKHRVSRSGLNSSRKSLSSNHAHDHHIDKPSRFGVTIIDEHGNDVTPKPLYEGALKSTLKLGEGQSSQTPTDAAISFASMFKTATQSVYAQPFSQSVMSSGGMKSSAQTSDNTNMSVMEPTEVTGMDEVTMVRREQVDVVTEDDLDKMVNVNLEETETIWMYEQLGTCISTKSPDANTILEQNKAYEALCASREGNDSYVQTGMQTFNDAPKNKDVQAGKTSMEHVGVTATTWDMYDTYNKETEPHGEIDNLASNKDSMPKTDSKNAKLNLESSKPNPFSSKSVSQSSNRGSSYMSSTFVGFETTVCDAPVEKLAEVEEKFDVEQQWDYIKAKNSNLVEQLLITERIVTENIHQAKLAAYRGLPVYEDVFKELEGITAKTMTVKSSSTIKSSSVDEIPRLEVLWSFNCVLTKEKNVSCFSWNKTNSDIIAIGYGSFSFSEQNKHKVGLACCWNVKNVEYPERVYHCSASVSAVDFSTYQPNLLAVGCSDGTIAVYNVRSEQATPVFDTFDCPGKHSSPIWQLKWVERENHSGEKNERLISVAADGRVVEWNIRKGLESTDLMRLKRSVQKSNNPSVRKTGKEKPEALLSRQAPGMSFDFHPKDTSVYLAGTEEGNIHKCSCSYNEQFLETYQGHSSSVYKVKWSLFNENMFLSCSADWTIKIWSQQNSSAVLSLLSSTKQVHDVVWSPFSSTVFCAVNEGAVEIWDLSINILDPIITNLAPPGIQISSCIFSQTSNSVLIGDTSGNSTVYQLVNVKDETMLKGVDSELHKVISSNYSERQTEEQQTISEEST